VRSIPAVSVTPVCCETVHKAVFSWTILRKRIFGSEYAQCVIIIIFKKRGKNEFLPFRNFFRHKSNLFAYYVTLRRTVQGQAVLENFHLEEREGDGKKTLR
jgi:hypothetical protein